MSDSSLINMPLIKVLMDQGAVRLFRSVEYKGIIINDFYLESKELCIQYCTNYAFRGKQDIKKRKVALQLATLLLNQNKH